MSDSQSHRTKRLTAAYCNYNRKIQSAKDNSQDLEILDLVFGLKFQDIEFLYTVEVRYVQLL